MKKNLISSIILMILCANALNVFAQTGTKGEKAPELKYSLRIDFKENVYASYKMDENTKVSRVYRDSVTKNYFRKLQYNFTQSPQSGAEDGLAVVTNIDSMKYAFKEGNAELLYDSQNPKAATVNTEFPDAIANMSLLNHQFAIVYNPKTEVIKVRGIDQPGDIDWLRNYVLKEGNDALDTAQKFNWMHSLKDEQAAWIGDVSKQLIPGKLLISPDSVWIRPIRLRLDGIDFFDTVSVRVSAYSKGEYSIEAVSVSLKANESADARFLGIPAPVPVKKSSGKGMIKMDINSSGWVKKVEINYMANVESQYKREVFNQTIETKSVWTLLGRYKW